VAFKLWEQIWRQLLGCGAMIAVTLMGMRMWVIDWKWTLVGGVAASGIYVAVLLITGGRKIRAEVRSLR
jgi:hypothetical protein